MDRKRGSDDVRALFDRWAREGDADSAEHRHGLTGRPVLASMDLREGDRLVDLGTGNGWACRYAARQGVRAVGVDLAPEMLKLAHRRGGGPAYARADLEALPFGDAVFDHAFSMEAIYYAEDLDRALAELRRVLSPGAEAHLVIDYYEENEASHSWPEDCGVPMHRLSEQEWVRALERVGFEGVAVGRVRTDQGDDWMADVGSLHVAGRA